ncbi:MAG: hypothetical protein RH947_09325 [Alcanivorax sp.]|nr:hypothetical protein [Alcanivorax sp.]|tara:strand:+ start:1731 stop:2444 length:714 start_codon:yes stop_codon:yes gene_type:complete
MTDRLDDGFAAELRPEDLDEIDQNITIGRAELLKIAHPGPSGHVNTRDFGGWLRIELDGLYVNVDQEGEAMLTPEEAAVLSEHPTGNPTEPVLSFPFDIGQLQKMLTYAAANGVDFPLNPQIFHAVVEEKAYRPAIEMIDIQRRRGQVKAKRKHTRHREDDLSLLIGEIQGKVRNRYSTKEVWNRLLLIAEQKTAPLLQVVDDGIEWDKGDSTTEILTRKNLSDRLRRDKKRQEGNA